MKHLERAFIGPNHWWRYILVTLIAFVGAQVIGALPLGMVMMFYTLSGKGTINPENQMDFTSLGIDPNIGLALMILSFIIGLTIFVLILKPFHKRNYKEVINGTTTIRWNKFFYSAAVWAIVSAVFLAIDYFISPANYQFNLNWSLFIPLILVAVCLIPFQTTFEEILFRGYLAQAVGRWTRNRWLVAILPAIFFGLLHAFNPEVAAHGFWIMMPQYIFFGAVFGFISIWDDGIESAMGVHAANNVFLAIFVTSKSSVMQTPALLVQDTINPTKDFIILIVASLIMIAVLAKKYNWNFAVLNQKVEGEKE
ncbi:CPBP family intramembrane metalloprotease [Ancylomarina euxinus]|uniref:CPBP family intramembrane metalloprotease n=1 Tax=Ancylomarina euxinus TaxID=2283627 RepID=A0A425XXK6_9BACT|nr:CPBP family intramembrane glutamic endopeptidase [Ancylomarina euxinus]MCZ4694714.1 CPBP family intramembrane metalloprotease [Ancylomarina euxinus]MUP16378.1 CPBP family intramembrane metalloprotease [Ancylomarina euxinus]RRG19409.1 CPBP family intramembrane metalloprotease [Ancylomarina euxinus]